MGVRALPRNNERLVWRTPKEPRKRERGTAWQFQFKLPLAFVEPCLVFGSNRRLYVIWNLWRLPPSPCVNVCLKTGCSLAGIFSESSQQIVTVGQVRDTQGWLRFTDLEFLKRTFPHLRTNSERTTSRSRLP